MPKQTFTRHLGQMVAIVEVNTRGYWEPIAMFNSEEVARVYAGDCHLSNPDFSYRVLKLQKPAQEAEWIEGATYLSKKTA